MALKDITLGQYYPGESAVHRLDPRTKILATLVYLVSLFLVTSFTGFAFAAFCFVLTVEVSKTPMSYILKGLKPIIFIIVFTAFINLFMTDGEVIWQWWFMKLTVEGIYRAFFMAIRLILLILGSSLLTLTTKPVNLTDGLERLMSPLAKLKVPTHELAMMITIALRFIPTLCEETDKIMKAQSARGADFENGSLAERAKALLPILIPLFVSAFRIAGDLAMAMEARCYKGGEGRTRMNAMKFARCDLNATIITCIYLGLIIGSRFLQLM